MKLKSYNSQNLPVSSKTKPALYINSKAGLLHFNATAALKLGLKNGDAVEFHQDEDSENDWFISKSKSGFVVRDKDKASADKGVAFNNTTLAKLLFEKLGYKKQTGSVLIGAEPVKNEKVEYWPLITAYLFKS